MGTAGKLHLLVTVTLNHNQLRSHLGPILALDEVESAVLVADEPGPELPKLRTVVPSRQLVRCFGRALAKLLVCLRIARRERVNVVIAYNLMPHGMNAAIAGRLLRIPSVVHLIGGIHEWAGGGWRSDNKILGRRRRPSRLLEALLLRVIRRFAVVATMGPAAREALVEKGVDPSRIVELPAAVDSSRFQRARADQSFAYDVVSITSLIPRKRPWDLLAILAQLHGVRPALRAAIVGKGPLLPELRAHADALGLTDVVQFLGFQVHPEGIVAESRVFLLASRHEGLSIALTEAMCVGVPPVVTRVGETASLVVDGVNGYLGEG